MPADFSASLGKETLKRLRSMAKLRGISVAELIRNMTDAEWTRENPPLALGFWRLDAPGEVETCQMCDHGLARGEATFAALLSNEHIIAPLCESCANTE